MSGSATSRGVKEIDRQFMMMALAMARRGLGTTGQNPSVGAVVVDTNNVILRRGWTQPGGRPHAEVVALERAGDAAKGATLYVTLEPCSHHGKTPPCTDAVIKAGIARVVCGVQDPNELVAGQGFAKLREAGVEVVENVLANESYWLALGHILKVTSNRPFVQLKLATGHDGLIAPGDGEPVWVTGPQARAQVHLLRARADAILVGIGTVLADDPSLDCRLPGLEQRSTKIIVLDRKKRLPDRSKVAKSGRKFDLPPSDNLVDLLANVADEGVTRLLVEGGPHVWRSFLEAGVVDEIVHFQGPKDVGFGGLKPFVDQGVALFEQSATFEKVDQRMMGGDKMMSYRNRHSMKAK
ncbi:MAG: bifunctional diaminohydroxyphosphoribosylaminopyrimidine deaminase/5-amino-6-(5-phosphoribosylamino)uracil reductase RibD [bacterium]|nr:bifunctional diaminohydroxyphosphoribosylaminopyrimidine deaminase/5-amino-6-(5-phosphoribosylamino)uracil reductase RibD [bacterium]